MRGRDGGGHAGPCGLMGKTWSFIPGGGSPGGLWTEVWDLTQVLKASSGGCDREDRLRDKSRS